MFGSFERFLSLDLVGLTDVGYKDSGYQGVFGLSGCIMYGVRGLQGEGWYVCLDVLSYLGSIQRFRTSGFWYCGYRGLWVEGLLVSF